MKKIHQMGFLAAGLAAAILTAGGLAGEPAFGAFKKGNDPVVIVYDPQGCHSTLKTTAVGYAPAGRGHSTAQKRLLAKRAATVAAYRNLMKASRTLRPIVTSGTFVEESSGYLKGAETTEIRYFDDGRAEVEMALPLGSIASDYEKTVVIFSKTHFPVCELEHEKKVLTKEEYEQLFKK